MIEACKWLLPASGSPALKELFAPSRGVKASSAPMPKYRPGEATDDREGRQGLLHRPLRGPPLKTAGERGQKRLLSRAQGGCEEAQLLDPTRHRAEGGE